MNASRLQQLIYFILYRQQIRLTKISEIGVHGDLDNCDYVLYPIELEPGLRSILDAKTETKALLKEPMPVDGQEAVESEA